MKRLRPMLLMAILTLCCVKAQGKKDLIMQNKNVQYVTLDNGYKVWTKRSEQGTIPILLLHGGPGSTHEYLECFEQFLPPAGYQLIFYDQLGSFFSDQPTDTELWNINRFCEEVEEVRKALNLNQFYLYGFSWGGALAIEYTLKYQQHLKGLIISNMAASMKSYELYINKLKSKKSFDLNKRYCQLSPQPEAIARTLQHQNKKIYDFMQGPNDFVVTGNLKTWDRWSDISKIHVPTLLIGAEGDLIDPNDIRKMGTLIPNAQTYICPTGSHFCFYDDEENYFKALLQFLNDQDLRKEAK